MILQVITRVIAIAGIGTLPTCACAADDAQFWTTLTGDVRLNGRDALTFDSVIRSRPDSAQVGQMILRAGVRRRLRDGASLQLTYGWVDTINEDKRDASEHRFGETLTFRLASLRAVAVDGRLTLEQRLPNSGGAMGWRARPRVRAVYTLSPKMDVQVLDELIVSLNDTPWGQRAGLTTNRAALLLHRRLNRQLGAALGYTLQNVRLRGGPDRQDHITGLTFDVHL